MPKTQKMVLDATLLNKGKVDQSREWRFIGLMSRVFANSPDDQGSIPGRVMPKNQKMVLDATLLNKGKVDQSREWRFIGLMSRVFEIVQMTKVQSQVESCQRLKKWYAMPPCLTRVKWINPGNGIAPSPTHWCSNNWKKEPSGHPWLRSLTLLWFCCIRHVFF